MDGYIMIGPDGCSRGLRCHGCGNAQAARGDEGSFSLGIGGGRRNEGDVEVGG